MISSDRLARLAGLLYLFLLPTTGPAYFYGQLAVVGDPATVLAKIQANQTLFELVIVVGAAGFVDWLVMGVVFHRLFSPISKVAASLLLVFVAASGMIALAALARRMDVLSMIHASGVIGTGGLDGRALMTLHSSNNLMLMSVLFWGLWLFPLGWLVIRSGFAPRILGILMLLGGVWYVCTFVGTVFNPDYQDTMLARVLGIAMGIPGTIGELGTAVWLLIKGAKGRPAANTPAAA